MMRKIVKFFPIVVILLLAAFLRLYKIDQYMTFLGDEGRDVLAAYNILHGHLTLLGPTSSVGGFFLGPIYYYFMAPFLLLFQYDPVGPAVMVAIFGIATVWLIYKVGSDFFTKPVGLLAAFFYSISPLVIAYSRSSWNPNLMPFFTLLTLYILYIGVTKNKYVYFLIVGFLYGILMQLHYLATFVGLVIVLYTLFSSIFFTNIHNRKEKILSSVKRYLIIFLGFIIGFSPFIAFEARHGFPNTISVFKFIFASKEVTAGGNFFGTVGEVFFRIFARLLTAFPPPEQVSLKAHSNIALWFSLSLILAISSSIYFIWRFYKEGKKNDQGPREKKLQYLLLFMWFFIGILLFGFYKKQIYDYYFGFIFPVPFLFVSSFLVWMFNKNITLKIISLVGILSITFVNLQGIPFKFIPNNQLNQAKQIANFVISKTDGKPYNFALITGGNSDHAYRYFFTIWNKPPTTILNTAIDPKRNSVTSQLLVVCEEVPCHPLGDSLWEVAGFGRAEISGMWNVSVVQVYKLVQFKGK